MSNALVTEDWGSAEPAFEDIGVEPVGVMLGTLVIVDGMLGGVIEGALALTGKIVGGESSGTPDGSWLRGAQAMPPGPITTVSGLC